MHVVLFEQSQTNIISSKRNLTISSFVLKVRGSHQQARRCAHSYPEPGRDSRGEEAAVGHTVQERGRVWGSAGAGGGWDAKLRLINRLTVSQPPPLCSLLDLFIHVSL